MQRNDFLKEVKRLNARADTALIGEAFDFSRQAHRGQRRKSGDPFFEHCIQVALILAEQGLDSITVAAALLHDTVEDAGVSIEELRNRFGGEIADLVDGVSKIGGLAFRSKEESQAEYFAVEFIDVWKDPEAAKPFAISLIPTQVFLSASGEELFRHEGFFSREEILAKWNELGIKTGSL